MECRTNSSNPDVVTRRVTARIGIFFDGTGNNRVNSQIGADCQALIEMNGGQHIKECAGRHVHPGSSYSNDLSNIARLVDLYRLQRVAENDSAGLKVYYPIYVSGRVLPPAGVIRYGRDRVSAVAPLV